MIMTDDLSKYAHISENGSILLGNNTVVDGYSPDRDIGVFTHIHSDHTALFTNALHTCSAIFVSKPTLDLLAALSTDPNDNIPPSVYFNGRHVYSLDFGESIIPRKFMRQLTSKRCFSDKITLYEAHHILGSSQVLVVTDDGTRIVYSGDFAHPKTIPIPCDVLVLDATHGDPMFNAPVDADSLENRLVECVEEEIKNGNPVCIRAHAGRLQYMMSILSERLPSNIQFLTNKENQKLVPVYIKYKMPIREMVTSEYKSDKIRRNSFPFVEFRKTQESKSESELSEKSAVFYLGGVSLGSRTTIRQNVNNKKHYFIEFGDHSTYNGIMDYVKKCSPKLVITDSYRSRWGMPLAQKITNTLGINAVSQPK